MVLRVAKFGKTETKIVVVRGWGRQDGELLFTGGRDSVWEDEKVLAIDRGDGCTQCECT